MHVPFGDVQMCGCASAYAYANTTCVCFGNLRKSQVVLVSMPISAVEMCACANALVDKQHLAIENVVFPQHVLMLIKEALFRVLAVVRRLNID